MWVRRVLLPLVHSAGFGGCPLVGWESGHRSSRWVLLVALVVMFSWQWFLLPAFFFLFFLSSFAITAGPQVAEALAAAVDLVETSLLAGMASVWGAGGWVRFWGIGPGAVGGECFRCSVFKLEPQLVR